MEKAWEQNLLDILGHWKSEISQPKRRRFRGCRPECISWNCLPHQSLVSKLTFLQKCSTVHERAKSCASSQWLSLEYVCDVLCFLSARLLMPVKKRKNSDPIMYSTYTSFQSWLRAGIVTFFLLLGHDRWNFFCSWPVLSCVELQPQSVHTLGWHDESTRPQPGGLPTCRRSAISQSFAEDRRWKEWNNM